MSKWVISDIHGCFITFAHLLDKLNLEKDDSLIFLGDYVDRGVNSKDVIDAILELKKHFNVITLKGNHEDFMIQSLKNGSLDYYTTNWMKNGGMKTLDSYGMTLSNLDWERLPEDHKEFLENLLLSYETDNFFLCHAGIDFHRELDNQYEDDLLWIREGFIKSEKQAKKMIIHGHTPEKPYSAVKFEKNRICVDTACVYGFHLSALNLDTLDVISVKNREE